MRRVLPAGWLDLGPGRGRVWRGTLGGWSWIVLGHDGKYYGGSAPSWRDAMRGVREEVHYQHWLATSPNAPSSSWLSGLRG